MCTIFNQSAYVTTESGQELEIVLEHSTDTWQEECHGIHTLSSQDTAIICAFDRETEKEVYLSDVEAWTLINQKDTSYSDSYPANEYAEY